MQKNRTLKFQTFMKFCASQLIIALTFFGITIAHSNHAQILEKKISIDVVDIPFQQMLMEIEQLAKVKFAYSSDQLSDEENVSLKVNDMPLSELLTKLLQPRRIAYKVHENEGVITLKKLQSDDDEKQSYANDPTDLRTASQTIVISGTVTDAEFKTPMAGVNIVVKGTTTGTTTDADGKFNIEGGAGDVLVFSFIGFRTVEVTVSAQTVIEVSMHADVTSLKAVEFNAGYWTVNKHEQTGNIGKVDAATIRQQPVSNTLAAIQGRVPGLEVIQSTGVPGGNFKVRIRGQNSISGGNDPLYIVDGVPFIGSSLSMSGTSGEILGHPLATDGGGMSPLNTLNPNDIESIEVLKDADATAIYGSRGANGVILITTKKGAEGKTRVDLNYYEGVGKVSNRMDLLSREQYLDMRTEAFANDGVTPQADFYYLPGYAPDLLLWDTTRYTDWQEELIGGTARTSDVQMSISGGDKRTQFMVGGAYHRETTVFPGSNADRRLSTHMSLSNTSPNEKLQTSVTLNYSENSSDLPKLDLTSLALTLSPVAPKIHADDGTLNWENGTWSNPLSYMNASFASRSNTLLTNVALSYKILDNLKLKTSVGYSNARNQGITKTPRTIYNPSYAIYFQNLTNFSDGNFSNWIIEPQAEWNTDIGAGRLQVLAGTTFLSQQTKQSSQAAYGFVSEALMGNIGAASDVVQMENSQTQYRYHAVFSRLNYALHDRYFVNLTARRDGSSRFGQNNQFANFGAVGAAWIFSNEAFFTNILSLVSFAKLRGSYGLTGNDQIGDYVYFDVYQPSGPYLSNGGLNPVRIPNPDFSWETNRKAEAGLALGFMKDRIMLDVSVYRNRSSNQLAGFALPPTAGFTMMNGNLPALLQNSGVEIEVNAINIDQGDVKWTTSFNLSVPRNKLLKYPNLENSPSYANRYVIGESLEIRKLLKSTGPDPQTGIYQFDDIDGDGSLTVLDRQSIVNVGRKYYGGLSNSFTFKGFQLDVMLQYVKQNGNNYMSMWGFQPGAQNNQPVAVMERWREEGSTAPVQKFTSYFSDAAIAYYDHAMNSDLAVSDASFIRVKNISLAYSLPQALLTKMRVQGIRVYLQGQNLATFTGYEGLDPEQQKHVLPPMMMLTGGIHLTL